eukprot:CAMPEP_0198220820 /NCGR_PEP_ID=MMETSP1445-20131203/80832_1 /TAXON_ID=36898 /ORGANISM="Pyramimonas sp., Strain CCMP2087" /LENGTH=53 /DNA_ID=CAMNT_0043898727 /DNA_START=22 /DNA_END=180 /DNA_ORIENTATION=+
MTTFCARPPLKPLVRVRDSSRVRSLRVTGISTREGPTARGALHQLHIGPSHLA